MSLSPDQLKTLRDRLLRLHKTLLDSDRAAYERAYGPVGSSGEWLQLVLGHEHFAWLRPFSGLIVRIDEWLAGDERLPDELTAFLKEVDRLTQDHKYATAGDRVVIVAGSSLGSPGMMNGVVIHTVGDRWAATPGECRR